MKSMRQILTKSMSRMQFYHSIIIETLSLNKFDAGQPAKY